MAATFALSIHADYGCRERGACCTAGWPIPIEPDRLRVAERAIATGHLCTEPPDAAPFVASPDAPTALLALVDHRCVFHRAQGQARCHIQRALGHDALPLACRQFPRVTIADPRGTSITLSHYCPTAAELLTLDRPAHILQHPQAFPSDGEYVGLDSREALPPLLRPDMAMSWEAWWQWEHESVRVLDTEAPTARALGVLRRAVALTSPWSPGDAGLASQIDRAFAAARTSPDASELPRSTQLIATVHSAIPHELRPAMPQASASSVLSDEVTRRFLAAHAFANWTAYLGTGLHAWMRSLEAAHALLEATGDVRTTDLWLRHLVDPDALADSLSRE